MFKILIIGNSSVGKTSFLFRYADDSFNSAFVSTVGIDFKVKTVFRQDKRVKLQIWVCPLATAKRLPFPNLNDTCCRILRARNGTEPSPPPTIAVQWDSFSCTTSLTKSPSIASKTGKWPFSSVPYFLPFLMVPLSFHLPQGHPDQDLFVGQCTGDSSGEQVRHGGRTRGVF